jgi:hypothetical protein
MHSCGRIARRDERALAPIEERLHHIAAIAVSPRNGWAGAAVRHANSLVRNADAIARGGSVSVEI